MDGGRTEVDGGGNSPLPVTRPHASAAGQAGSSGAAA
jgi:hypothetical protein